MTDDTLTRGIPMVVACVRELQDLGKKLTEAGKRLEAAEARFKSAKHDLETLQLEAATAIRDSIGLTHCAIRNLAEHLEDLNKKEARPS